MSSVKSLPVNLTDAQIEEFGREIDEIGRAAKAKRGAQDRRYLLRIIRIQIMLSIVGRAIILGSFFFLPGFEHQFSGAVYVLSCLAIGAIVLGFAKILQTMEIGHNVLHGQWDWMNDPKINSKTWEWDFMSPSDRWQNSHNVSHHYWTNVLGKDIDIGYQVMRVTPLQAWSMKYLPQPLYFILLMMFFETAIAFHEKEIFDVIERRKKLKDIKPLLGHIFRKVWIQVRKDYLYWPAIAVLLMLPFSLHYDIILFGVFVLVYLANLLANTMRSAWAFICVFCGHFPEGVHNFTEEQVQDESRGQWYLRQLLGSANFNGGPLMHVISGNVSLQIEHHLFPDLCSNRYAEVAPQVKAVAEKYGLPYNTASIWRQFGSTWSKNLRLAFPGGKLPSYGTS